MASEAIAGETGLLAGAVGEWQVSREAQSREIGGGGRESREGIVEAGSRSWRRRRRACVHGGTCERDKEGIFA